VIFAVDSGLLLAPPAHVAHAEGAYKDREAQPDESSRSRAADTALQTGQVGAQLPYFVAARAAFAGTPGMPLAVEGSTDSGSDAVLFEMHLELAAVFDQW
jgi:hypothetical protein